MLLSSVVQNQYSNYSTIKGTYQIEKETMTSWRQQLRNLLWSKRDRWM